MEKTVIKLPPEIGRQLKTHCAARGVTMVDFVSRLILHALVAEAGILSARKSRDIKRRKPLP